jgi:hypothetical protein
MNISFLIKLLLAVISIVDTFETISLELSTLDFGILIL